MTFISVVTDTAKDSLCRSIEWVSLKSYSYLYIRLLVFILFKFSLVWVCESGRWNVKLIWFSFAHSTPQTVHQFMHNSRLDLWCVTKLIHRVFSDANFSVNLVWLMFISINMTRWKHQAMRMIDLWIGRRTVATNLHKTTISMRTGLREQREYEIYCCHVMHKQQSKATNLNHEEWAKLEIFVWEIRLIAGEGEQWNRLRDAWNMRAVNTKYTKCWGAESRHMK